MNQENTTKKVAIFIATIAIVFVFASCSQKQLVEQNNQQSNNQNQQQVQQGDEPQETEIDTSDWQTYQNEKYGFEFKYPENWEKRESTSDDGNEHSVALATPEIIDQSISSPRYDADITIKYYSNIETKTGGYYKQIKSLDDYVNADFFVVDFACLYHTVELESVDNAYFVELGGNYGHYALMVDAQGEIFEIIFGRNKTFGEECGNKELKLDTILNEDELKIVNSFKIIE